MIREYRPADLPTLMDIGNRAWRGIYQMYRQAFGEELFTVNMPGVDHVKGEQIKQHCTAYPGQVYVCEENDAIAGFITFSMDRQKGIGQIGNNAVDPDCGLKGIGQQMYQAALERFRAEGMTHAKVQTGLDDAHAPARRAYERAGFNIKVEDVTYFRKL